MSQRSRLEDRYTVTCPHCKVEWIKADKAPNQKWALCPRCRVTKSEYNRKVR